MNNHNYSSRNRRRSDLDDYGNNDHFGDYERGYRDGRNYDREEYEMGRYNSSGPERYDDNNWRSREGNSYGNWDYNRGYLNSRQSHNNRSDYRNENRNYRSGDSYRRGDQDVQDYRDRDYSRGETGRYERDQQYWDDQKMGGRNQGSYNPEERYGTNGRNRWYPSENGNDLNRYDDPYRDYEENKWTERRGSSAHDRFDRYKRSDSGSYDPEYEFNGDRQSNSPRRYERDTNPEQYSFGDIRVGQQERWHPSYGGRSYEQEPNQAGPSGQGWHNGNYSRSEYENNSRYQGMGYGRGRNQGSRSDHFWNSPDMSR